MPGSSSSPPTADHGLLDEPLGLTVHSLPSPREAVEGDAQRTVTGRLKMLLVLAVCAAPVIASYFTYYVIHPQSGTSFGQLIEPQRPLPDIAAATLDGKTTTLAKLRGQWLLITVGSGACDPECERNLYLQRQLRESLGKDKDRVDWVWLVDDAQPVRPALLPALSQATVLRIDGAQLARWLQPESGRSVHDHVYVVDPMGNWMMRFPPVGAREIDTTAARNMKRDVERLLRASASWDKPGR